MTKVQDGPRILLLGASAQKSEDSGCWMQALCPPEPDLVLAGAPGAWRAIPLDGAAVTASAGGWAKALDDGIRVAAPGAYLVQAQVWLEADMPTADAAACLAVDGASTGLMQTISPMVELAPDTERFAGGCSLRQVVKLRAGQTVSLRISPQGGTGQIVPGRSCLLLIQKL